MRLLAKILIVVAAISVFLFSGAFVFMVFRGKAVITSQLEHMTKRKVSIGSFRLAAPLNFEIEDLEIEGLARIKKIFISPSITRFLIGKVVLNDVSINKPEINFERQAHALPADEFPEAVPLLAKAKNALPKKLAFKRLSVKDGKINFSDHTVGPAGIRITVKDLNFNFTNLYLFPSTTISNFDLSGKIPWQEGTKDGVISLEGWMNYHKKDMQATLKIESIDGVYLYPYYSKWVDLDKARIDRANLNFTSNINGLNNNIIAECHLELTDIVRTPLAPGESEEKAAKITDQVMDIFRALNQGKIVLDFAVRTKMDSPQFGFGNIKMALEDKLAKARNGSGLTLENILLLPARLLVGTVKGTTDFSKAIIDGSFAVGGEFKKAFEDTFKKESQEKPEQK